MKIGILTQPLHTNYGGVLQAYALQKVLRNLGHDVYTVNVSWRNTYYSICRGILVRFIKKFVIRRNTHGGILPNNPSQKQQAVIAHNFNTFIKENIKLTHDLKVIKNTKQLDNYNFDAYIVGSDQVWRPRYSPGIRTYFLDFLGDNSSIIKISYAASFGVDNWEFTEKDTRACKRLAANFNAISVRECSGIELCKKFLDIDATQVLDPTFLVDRDHYWDLVQKARIPAKKKSMMVYVLDKSAKTEKIIDRIHACTKLEINALMPVPFDKKIQKIQNCVYPKVEEWLKGFMDADFVATDSFHGTVFSILFNKPFISIGNRNRGLSRFTSILKLFELEDRLLIDDEEYVDHIVDKAINFDKVNLLLKKLKGESIHFIENNLNGSVKDQKKW